MGTISINIVLQYPNGDNKHEAYLDIVTTDQDYCYKSWIPFHPDEMLANPEDRFTYNESGESYSETLANLGDPVITLIIFEE